MNNLRLTSRERGLIKGALRRVFARSDLRKQVIEKSYVNHGDPARKRVKQWCLCPICHTPVPKSFMVVDHLIPIINVHETLTDLDWDTLINRMWCDEVNLQAICAECHLSKCNMESKERTKHRRLRRLIRNE